MNTLRTVLSRLLCNSYTVAAACIALWAYTPYMSEANKQLVSFAMINIMLAQSMNMLTGMAGQISLGHAAFMGISAFTSVILVRTAGLTPLLSIPAGMLLSTLAGYLLSFPAARVKEFYLAMMTLGFGMIFVEVVREWDSLTGGVMGITGVPSPQLRTLMVLGASVSTASYLRTLVALAGGIIFLLSQFVASRLGRAYLAVHVSDLSARSIGIDSGQIKRQAYVLSAALAGLAGGLYGHLVSYVGPESFEIGRSIEVLVMAVVGGLGSIAGQVVGATLLTWLPLQLEAFADYKFILYGAILCLVFIIMPRGLAGLLLLPPRFIAARFLEARGGPTPARPVRERVVGVEVLRWDSLRLDFAGLVAIRDFSCSLVSGRVMGLIGPNGSGKSTTINVLSGIYKPTAGRVLLAGRDIGGIGMQTIAAYGLVRTFQDPRLVGSFTVAENVLLGAHMQYRYTIAEAFTGLGRKRAMERAAMARVTEALEIAGLDEVRDRVLDTLPYGYRRLVDLARAWVADPDVLLLDEPGAGLSDTEILRLKAMVHQLADRGVAILIVDHHMDLLAELVDSVVVLDSGREIFRGSMADMRSDPGVAECYLGATEEAVRA